MELDAAAEALAGEVVPSTTETETSDYDALSAAFDKASAKEAPAEEPVELAEPVAAEPVEEAPTDLPFAVKQNWADIPKEAREAVLTSQREMSRKLSEATKVAQGLNPIRDSLVRAAQEIPSLADLKPAQVADEIFELAKISHQFHTRPVETLVHLARQHGIEAQLRAVFSGQAPGQDAQHVTALQNEIRGLQQQLARVADPEYFREQVAAVTQQERVLGEVDSFASTQDHWSEIEHYMPTLIEAVKAKDPGAPAKDVLKTAYDLALQLYLPEAKAKTQAAVEAQPVADPERTEAALKAKSVNVTSRSNGAVRELTERERLAAIYDRASKK